MFNEDFYPTPREVIERMIAGLDLFGKTILEPSAGNGHIVDYLKDQGANVIVCEKHNDLAMIAAQKADRFLKPDFLEVTSEEVSHIDYIIMNPPFTADEKHILHAFEIAPANCEIVALCNSNSLKHRHTRSRQQLNQIIESNGGYEILGEVFKYADRKTNVNVAKIHLYKQGTGETEFEGYFDLSEDFEQTNVEGIMKHDAILEIVNRYVGAVKMFNEVEATNNRVNNLTELFTANRIEFGAFNTSNRGGYSQRVDRETFKKELQKAAWKTIFDKMDMAKYVTKSVAEDINRFVEQQQQVPFTRSNIYKMIHLVIGTRESRMRRVLVDVFDRLTKHYKDNRFQLEGWKTNSEYRVNRKFIINWGLIEHSYGGGYHANYRGGDGYVIDDLTKAICFLTGENYDDMDTWWSWTHNEIKPERYSDYELIELGYEPSKDNPGKWINTKKYRSREFGVWYNFNYFEIKAFKKGTTHIKFKSEEIWNLFNQEACKEKGFTLASKFTSDFRQKSKEVVKY